MHGLAVFSNLPDALRAGFRVHDRWEHGYVIVMNTPNGLAKGFVDFRLKKATND